MRVSGLFQMMVLSLLVAGCQKPVSETQTTIWSKGQGPAPLAFSSPQFTSSDRTVMIGDEIVRHSAQSWEGAVIEGGSFQTVETLKGDLLFGRMDFLQSPDTPIRLKKKNVEKMIQDRFQFLESVKKDSPVFREMKAVSDPEVVLIPMSKSLSPAYRIDFLDNKKHEVIRYWFSKNESVLRQEKVSSHIYDAPAWIYTLSEGRTIQEVLLRKLMEGVEIGSTSHQVNSQAPLELSHENIPWRFSPDDPRFDQVQVYYFVQQGLDFFDKSLGFKLPVSVQAETAVGYPDKTNAAFSYNNQIRFGAGDGVEFKSLAQDPSIVIHELGHVLTATVARLPTQGEGGSLNEAFADYFSAACLKTPRLGSVSYLKAPFLRNLETNIPFSEKNGGLYHDSQIVSGTLWAIRSKIGAEVADKLALRTLARLGPSRTLSDFANAIRLAAKDQLKPEALTAMNEIMRQRQWPD